MKSLIHNESMTIDIYSIWLFDSSFYPKRKKKKKKYLVAVFYTFYILACLERLSIAKVSGPEVNCLAPPQISLILI